MRLGVALRIPRAMLDRGWGRYRSTSVDRLAIGKKYRLESQPPVHFKAQATCFVILFLFSGKRIAIQLKKAGSLFSLAGRAPAQSAGGRGFESHRRLAHL